MGAMVVLWSFLGVLKHLLAPPLRCPCLLPLKKKILHLFLGVPAATVGGTGTRWHTRGYAPDLHSYDFHFSALTPVSHCKRERRRSGAYAEQEQRAPIALSHR